MAKNSFQDIITSKSVKNKTIENKVMDLSPKRIVQHRKIESDDFYDDNENKPKKTLWFIAIIAIVFLIFSISTLFSSASVTVSPKEKNFNLSSSFSAVKNSSSDVLSYDSVILSGEATENIATTGMKDSTVKATGTIILYNNFNTTPQVLLAGTRLEGSNGKIYNLNAKVSIPGITKDKLPGSIEAGITAFDFGQDYNSDPLDFKILGFKGSLQYTKIYGRSKNPIVGGFKGQIPIIDDIAKAKALTDLQSSLKDKLLKKATDQIPDGFILYKDAVFFDIPADVPTPEVKDNQAVFTLKGTIYGFIFNEKNLTIALVNNLIPQFDGSDVYISNIKDLIFALSSKDGDSFSNTTKIDFTLTGSPNVIWKVDTDKLATDLLNSSKKDFNTTLSKYTNISSADLVLRPAWRTTFPDKVKNIKITVNYPKI
ncbi:MAG: hypothetical protein NTW62_03295 [Candidatus Nomurabacteria bacterium]|nr:hypothetical protein [Candidatus Nomurabacteria bacterium]